MSEIQTQKPSEKAIYRPLKPNRVYPCGCEEKEVVDSRSGMYMWEKDKRCDDHK